MSFLLFSFLIKWRRIPLMSKKTPKTPSYLKLHSGQKLEKRREWNTNSQLVWPGPSHHQQNKQDYGQWPPALHKSNWWEIERKCTSWWRDPNHTHAHKHAPLHRNWTPPSGLQTPPVGSDYYYWPRNPGLAWNLCKWGLTKYHQGGTCGNCQSHSCVMNRFHMLPIA